MNASFLQDLVAAGLPALGKIADNGECQFLSLDTSNQTDDQGFLAPAYTERTAEYVRCSWSRVRSQVQQGTEQIVGGKPEPFERYQITVAKTIGGACIEVVPSDRVRLREDPSASDDYKTLEVISLTNQTNTAWHIEAAEIEAG